MRDKSSLNKMELSGFETIDEERNYKGVIEMSQDVTEIKALEGEKRLLDWN